MANWKVIGGIAGGLFVLGGIGNAISGHTDTRTTSRTAAGATATAAATAGPGVATTTAATVSPRAANEETAVEKKTVPQFVGMGLQSAQDAAQASGFYGLDSHDALGRERMQILDRNWKVCSQNVKAGSRVGSDTTLDFGAVKLEESCPAGDKKPPKTVGGRMPDFAGRSVKAARAALDSGTSITVDDVSGEDRFVLLESNWQVCTQTPAAGVSVSGQPVTLKAVKFGETCP